MCLVYGFVCFLNKAFVYRIQNHTLDDAFVCRDLGLGEIMSANSQDGMTV